MTQYDRNRKKEAITDQLATICRWAIQMEYDLDRFDSYKDEELYEMLEQVNTARNIIGEVCMMADKEDHMARLGIKD